jgi:hypothetical protein
MGGCARVALVSMTVSASFGLAGCAAIDALKQYFPVVRYRELHGRTRSVARQRARGGPCNCAGENPKGGRQGTKEEDQRRRRVNCSGRRPLCFLQRNHRSPVPPRRQGRTKPRGNPRRPLRCDCGLPIPKRRRPEFFHAEIGHRRHGHARQEAFLAYAISFRRLGRPPQGRAIRRGQEGRPRARRPHKAARDRARRLAPAR